MKNCFKSRHNNSCVDNPSMYLLSCSTKKKNRQRALGLDRAGPGQARFITAIDYMVKNKKILFHIPCLKNWYYRRYRVDWNPLWLWKEFLDCEFALRRSQSNYFLLSELISFSYWQRKETKHGKSLSVAENAIVYGGAAEDFKTKSNSVLFIVFKSLECTRLAQVNFVLEELAVRSSLGSQLLVWPETVLSYDFQCL